MESICLNTPSPPIVISNQKLNSSTRVIMQLSCNINMFGEERVWNIIIYRPCKYMVSIISNVNCNHTIHYDKLKYPVLGTLYDNLSSLNTCKFGTDTVITICHWLILVWEICHDDQLGCRTWLVEVCVYNLWCTEWDYYLTSFSIYHKSQRLLRCWQCEKRKQCFVNLGELSPRLWQVLLK